jgi:general secretion pathway protein G
MNIYTYIRNAFFNRKGFSLIELLIVIVILGLLAAIVGPRFLGKIAPAKQTSAKTQIELLGQALDQFRLDTGRYPSTSEGLAVLITRSGTEGWDGPYLKKAVPNDPWKRPYIYRSPGTNSDYDIVSYGLDGMEGGEKESRDINSWE